MKYSRDSYQILLFGEFGDKLKKKSAKSLHKARKKANKYINKNPTHSFVINRTIINSKHTGYKWDYNDDNG